MPPKSIKKSENPDDYKVRVFIGWSQTISRRLAEILKAWLESIFSSAEFHCSTTDIDAGSAWHKHLRGYLENADCGVFCLTSENSLSPWIHFEAGALSRTDHICPFLFDVNRDHISSPLSHYQCVDFLCDSGREEANKESVKVLFDTLNKICKDKGHGFSNPSALDRAFNRAYQELEVSLNELKKEADRLKEEAEKEARYSGRKSDATDGPLEAELKAKANLLKKEEELLKDAQANLTTRETRLKEEEDELRQVWRALPHSLGKAMGDRYPSQTFSIGFLSFWLDILKEWLKAWKKTWPRLSDESQQKQSRENAGRGIQEVIKEGTKLLSEQEKDTSEFYKVVKEKLDLPYLDDQRRFQCGYGISISLRTIRNALYVAISDISSTSRVKQEKEAPKS